MHVITKKVLLFSQVFGYLPLKSSSFSKTFQPFEFSYKLFFWSIFVVSLQTVFGCFTLYRRCKNLNSEFAGKKKMNTSILANFLDILPLNTLALVMFISSTTKYPHFIKMCKLIEKASNNLNINKNNNTTNLKTPLVFIITTVLFALNTVSLIMSGSFLEYITFRTIHFAEAALLLHFSQAVQSVADLFRKFNHRFKSDIIKQSFGQLMTNHSLPDIEYIQSVTSPAPLSTFDFNYLTSVYWLLHQAKTQANLFYGSQLFFAVFTSLLHSTLSFYFSLIEIWQGVKLEELEEMALKVAWALFHFTYIVLLVWPCNSLTCAANETAQIVCKLVIRDLNPELKEQMDSFLLQLLHHNASITAMGFFPLQKNILISIAGTVTTYLFITIQFQTNGN